MHVSTSTPPPPLTTGLVLKIVEFCKLINMSTHLVRHTAVIERFAGCGRAIVVELNAQSCSS